MSVSGDVTNDAAAVADAMDWFNSFLCQPHPDLGRTGSVCPFMAAALRGRTVHLRAERIDISTAHGELHRVVRQMTVEITDDEQWGYGKRDARAVVATLPGLPPALWPLLDQVHAETRYPIVSRGLMIGQFYPECTVPGARNRLFLPSRSPLPMMAMRYMAFRDILFLADRADCFRAYARRYAHHYRSESRMEPAFRQRYHDAMARFATSK